jgi:hypothetical protein
MTRPDNHGINLFHRDIRWMKRPSPFFWSRLSHKLDGRSLGSRIATSDYLEIVPFPVTPAGRIEPGQGQPLTQSITGANPE